MDLSNKGSPILLGNLFCKEAHETWMTTAINFLSYLAHILLIKKRHRCNHKLLKINIVTSQSEKLFDLSLSFTLSSFQILYFHKGQLNVMCKILLITLYRYARVWYYNLEPALYLTFTIFIKLISYFITSIPTKKKKLSSSSSYNEKKKHHNISLKL